jgi:isochorismate pyruvate lyase
MARKKAPKKSEARPKAKRKAAPKRRAAKSSRGKEVEWRVKCKDLGDVRAHIDMLDQLIAPLLCKRQYFVEQAANFKPSVSGVVIPARVEEIIRTVRTIAESMNGDPDTLERVYREIIDAFTAAEQRHWRALHK